MSNCSPYKKWEEAGASLVTSLKDYADLCLNLGPKPLLEGENSKDLVSRIESALAGVHATMTRHLDESRSALIRTRNKLRSPFLRIPEEIMSKIFLSVVFDQNAAEEPVPMKQKVWQIYHRLYTLIGVYSAWRDIAVNRGALWSVIPIVTSLFANELGPFELCLERAGGALLHLAIATELPNLPIDIRAFIVEHGGRFHTINLSLDRLGETRGVITGLLENNNFGSLSELSIQCITTRVEVDSRLRLESEYILPRDNSQRGLFARLVKNLTALRISGAQFQWEAISFSASLLVELRIQQVSLGYDDTIIPFMRTLSSAPNLQVLKIITVSTFRRLLAIFEPADHQAPRATVTFPALRSLLLQDLYLNTLDRLLSILGAGSYSFTLFLTRKCLETNIRSELDLNLGLGPGLGLDGETEFEDLCRAMKHTSIDTLMIDGHSQDEWLVTTKLRALLKSIPALKTLKMHRWNFGKGLCKSLMRTNLALVPFEGPTFQNLSLTAARIHAKQGFLDMVSSHALQQLVLGGEYQVTRNDKEQIWEPVHEDSDIIQEVRGNVPDLCLVEGGYQPPEFQSVVWKLW